MSLQSAASNFPEAGKPVTQSRIDTLAIYDDLLQTIWRRIAPTLGSVTVAAITTRALDQTKATYPILSHLKISPEGIVVDGLRHITGQEEGEALGNALRALIIRQIDLLIMLTGDVLVKQLLQEIEILGQ